MKNPNHRWNPGLVMGWIVGWIVGCIVIGIALALAQPVQAQTLRWASQGDALTVDPHSQNEGLTNSMNGQVYETLVLRDRTLALVPGLALS